MEGLFATLLLAGLMAGALVLLGRTWPRSSRSGGYRAGLRGRRDDGTAGTTTGGAIREDDDVQWRWDGDGPDDADPPGG